MDLIDNINYTQSKEYKQVELIDVLDNIDDLECEQDIERAIKELKARI